jgi:hypothetical protein
VYGDIDDITQSNTMIDYCPVPTKLCLSPIAVIADAINNQSSSTLLNLTAGWWGCDVDLFSFRCVFDSLSSTQTSSASLVEVIQ